MAFIRTFICIELPLSIKEYLAALQRRLEPLGRGVRWVKPENIHLTLNFLGDVEKASIDKVVQAVARAAQEIPPFSVRLSAAGAFPNLNRPRVYWVGVQDGSGVLLKLQKKIENELDPDIFAIERRKYSPHLTIGRVKFKDGLEKISDELRVEKCPPLDIVANEVTIMKSELSPQGAVYTPLAAVKL